MPANTPRNPPRPARRHLLATGAGLLGAACASPLLAQPSPSSTPASAPRVKGPAVWLDLDQAELDRAYDQSQYAPNLPQITRRYGTNSDTAPSRLGAPQRAAYGPTPIEGLDIYRTDRPKAPVHVFLHGGAWRGVAWRGGLDQMGLGRA